MAGAAHLVTTTVTALSAADGTGSFQLYGNYQISPINTFWTIQTYAVGGIIPATTAKYQLNTGGTFDLSSLTPINSTPLPPAGTNTTLQGLNFGGTGADLSATGGANNFVRQSSSGAPLSVGPLAASDLAPITASQNTFLGGPASGGSGASAYRKIVSSDLPVGTAVVTVGGIQYTTVQAAINALPSGGGAVLIPPGTYVGPTTIPSGTALIGISSSEGIGLALQQNILTYTY